jgi:phosphoglycolate phosphatase-like HAD superfamily hydrolase
MNDWMARLARHYDRMRARYADDELLILLDIDGAILDLGRRVTRILRTYDEEHGTHLFRDLDRDAGAVRAGQVDRLLAGFNLPSRQLQRVREWYVRHRWSPAMLQGPQELCPGVMEVIRWFQIQPRTHVGLNTGRPESVRAETLQALNELGGEYRVRFTDDMLHMNRAGWGEAVPESKVRGVRHFQQAGYRVIAAADNEPENLRAIAEADDSHEILLLHADTLFDGDRSALPAGSAVGASYDITELITQKALFSDGGLPHRVQFVWHGVNDEANIRQFVSSSVEWAEFDVRTDGEGRLILRHDSLAQTPLEEGEELLPLDDALGRLNAFGKAVKLDLKEDGGAVDAVIDVVRRHGYPVERLWFNGYVEVLGEAGFRKLSAAFPGAILQCPIGFVAPLIGILPDQGRRVLRMLRDWGVTRFSVEWKAPKLVRLLERMDEWGYEVNIYNVPDLPSFLSAVLLQPRSITSDFNFPQWHYFGRGAGEDLRRHEYELRRKRTAEA